MPAPAVPSTGLASESLRRAIHDLRGPLNTLSILHEVLRTSGPSTAASQDALGTAARAVRNLSHMLDRLRSVADTLVVDRIAVPLAESLAGAVGRAAAGPQVHLQSSLVQPDDLAAASCPQRLGQALDTLLACAIAALPRGGSLQFSARPDGSSCRMELQLDGPEIALQPTRTQGKLDTNDPGAADWFRLACQVEGLAARLVIGPASLPARLVIHLPRA